MAVLTETRIFCGRVLPGARRKSYMHVRRLLNRKPQTCITLRRCNYAERGRLESCARDPIGYEGSPWHIYEYVFSRPSSLVDPEGLSPPVLPGPLPWDPNYPTSPESPSSTNSDPRRPWNYFAAWGKYCGLTLVGPGEPEDSLDAACKRHDDCVPKKTLKSCVKWLPCAARLCRDAYHAEHGGCAQDYPDDPDKQAGCERAAWYIQQFFCTQSLTSSAPPSTDPPIFPKSQFPCFAPDTTVLTPAGAVRIGDIVAGDMVYGFNFGTRSFEATKVSQVLSHEDGGYKLNRLLLGSLETVEVTDGHPLYTGTEWLLSHEFASQKFVAMNQQKVVIVASGRHVREVPVVINLITESGTYLVGESGVIASGKVAEDD